MDLLPIISKLSHLDAHVFLVGCILGNRFQGELGLVPVKRVELAKLCGTTEYRLRQSIRRLRALGLVDFQASGWLFMAHYTEQGGSSGAETAPQEHPSIPQGAPQEHFGCSSGAPSEQQLQLVVEDAVPLNGITKRGKNGKPKLPPRSKKIIWDETENRLKAIDETWKISFREQWTETLGEEEYLKEMEKATAWLRGNPDRRKSNAKLDKFLLNWMVKCIR